jgi:hypothetical protein
MRNAYSVRCSVRGNRRDAEGIAPFAHDAEVMSALHRCRPTYSAVARRIRAALDTQRREP